jgi:hypothetical protein
MVLITRQYIRPPSLDIRQSNINHRRVMLRRFGAAISVMALLLGFVSAPYTHVHQSGDGVSDPHNHHSRPAALLHAHVTPHSGHHDSHHPPVEGDQDAEQKIWSVAGFVFHPAPAAHAPSPALPVSPVAHAVSFSSWVAGVSVTQPGAHGPPFIAGSSLRAPPFGPSAVS